MTIRRLLTIVSFLALILVAAYFAWRAATSAAAITERDHTITDLNRRLSEAEARFIAQREMLRQDQLNNTVRTPDEFLALFPAKFPRGNWQPAESQFEDCWFRAGDGLRLHGWLVRHASPRAVVLFIHGNAGNLTQRAERAAQLSQRNQVSVLLFDYRGYGRSEGTPTIDGVLLDARAARALLAEREGIAESEIVLLGESLGGAVAVDLASRDGARGLILESSFSSLKEVAAVHYPRLLVDTLVADRLNSAASIRSYHGPLVQIHGDADRTIPEELARRLFAAANERKQFVLLPGHDHNDPLPEVYYQSLDEFFKRL